LKGHRIAINEKKEQTSVKNNTNKTQKVPERDQTTFLLLM